MGCAASDFDVEEPQKNNRNIGTKSHRTFETLYDIKEQLGEGAFGKVCVCVNKRTKRSNAVKILQTSSEKEETMAGSELKMWMQVGFHKHVVGLFESYVESDFNYFVMQQCRYSLSDMLMEKGDDVYLTALLDSFLQVFSGLQHCHSMKVAHRDMKASNCLVDFDGTIKIADFGLAVSVPMDGAIGMAGSVPYMSPEMLLGQHYGLATDIWSCGVSLYYLTYGRYPYEGSCSNVSDAYTAETKVHSRRVQIAKAVRSNEPKPAHEPLQGIDHPPVVLRNLIKSLMTRNQDLRPCASRCVDFVLSTFIALGKDCCDSEMKKESLNVHLLEDSASTKATSQGSGSSDRGSSLS